MDGAVATLLTDDSGYTAEASLLRFLDLSEQALAACSRHQHPLGVSRDEYESFKTSLDAALKRDGIDDADIRLQGSSARFFSGTHKTMPLSPEEILQSFLDHRERVPDNDEFERILAKIRWLWSDSDRAPLRRPFDSMYRLGIDRFPSDLDVQISSDAIVLRALEFVETLGMTASHALVENPKYSFIRKEYVSDVCPFLTSWALRQSDVLPRPVTIAAFPSAGPPRMEEGQSSHFKTSDWRIYLGGGGA